MVWKRIIFFSKLNGVKGVISILGTLGIVFVGIGLAMDAFAVSICKGLSMKQLKIKNIIMVGTYFGIFQALMPVIGYFLGVGFEDIVSSIDHWVAFILLLLIGLMMIKEAFHEEEEANDDLSFKTMFLLAIATSIDALAIRHYFCFFRSKYCFFSNYDWCYYIYDIYYRCIDW